MNYANSITQKLKLLILVFSLMFISTPLMAVKQNPEIYIPLKANKQLKYRFSMKQVFGEAGGIIKTKVLPKRQMNGKDVIPFTYVITVQTAFGQQVQQAIDFYLKEKDGIRLYASQGANDIEPILKGDSHYLLKLPFKKGTRWEHKVKASLFTQPVTLGVECQIVALDDVVTVSAGNFGNCIQVVKKGKMVKSMGLFGEAKVEYEERNWYAPKVGLVKSIIKEQSNHLQLGTGGTFTMVLTSKKSQNKQ